MTEAAIKDKNEQVREDIEYWKAKGYKILSIVVPITGEWIYKKFALSLLSVISGDIHNLLMAEYKIKATTDIGGEFPINHNRNKSIARVRSLLGADYIMHMDADQTFNQKTIINLLDRMSKPAPDGSEVEIVSGMYYLKTHPFRPVLGRYVPCDEFNLDYLDKWGLACHGECGDPKHKGGHNLVRYQPPHYWPSDRLFRSDVIGVGCVLSKASMWDKLDYPYFRYSPDPIHGMEKGDDLEISEDMYWCAQMHRKGIKVWIDPKVQCGHLGMLEVSEDLYKGSFKAAVDHVNALPDGNNEKKLFFDNILDLR